MCDFCIHPPRLLIVNKRALLLRNYVISIEIFHSSTDRETAANIVVIVTVISLVSLFARERHAFVSVFVPIDLFGFAHFSLIPSALIGLPEYTIYMHVIFLYFLAVPI